MTKWSKTISLERNMITSIEDIMYRESESFNAVVRTLVALGISKYGENHSKKNVVVVVPSKEKPKTTDRTIEKIR